MNKTFLKELYFELFTIEHLLVKMKQCRDVPEGFNVEVRNTEITALESRRDLVDGLINKYLALH